MGGDGRGIEEGKGEGSGRSRRLGTWRWHGGRGGDVRCHLLKKWLVSEVQWNVGCKVGIIRNQGEPRSVQASVEKRENCSRVVTWIAVILSFCDGCPWIVQEREQTTKIGTYERDLYELITLLFPYMALVEDRLLCG